MKERVDLVHQEGATTLIYPRRGLWLLAVVAMIVGLLSLGLAGVAQFPSFGGAVFLLLFLVLGDLVVRFLSRWRSPLLIIDDQGVQDPYRKHKPYIALWNEVTGLAIKPLRRGRALSLEVNDSEAVLRRQGATLLVKWLYRQNARYGLTVVAIRETGLLPITLERLDGMMRQRLDAYG